MPTDALTLNGNLKAEVVSHESINGINLLALNMNGHRFYAVNLQYSEAGKTLNSSINIGIDFKKITVISDGKTIIAPLSELNKLNCKFVKRKEYEEVNINGKIKRKKAIRFGFDVAGKFFQASEDMSQKIFAALGIKKAFTTPLNLECGIYDLAISDSGIPAKAEGYLDFGSERFLKCDVDGSEVYVKIDGEASDNIYLQPNFENVGVLDIEREIKII